MKVIVADDSLVIRTIIAKALNALGLTPLMAANGPAVLSLLDQEGSDVVLILLDWKMPLMDGLGVLRAIKKDRRWDRIPVVMVSMESEDESMVLASQSGAIGYVTKPFTVHQLKDRIREIIGA